MSKTSIDKLANLWVKQLLAEFTDICWQYSVTLVPPVFEISQSICKLGSWHPEIRTLKISSHLILNHSWTTAIAVLKHEMAHQICTETYKTSEGGHGESFLAACDLLGLPEEYRGARADLPENVSHIENGIGPTSAGRRFIAKVEKLLSLAQSSNEHEASLAMQKANELIKKYHLSQLEDNSALRYSFAIINKKRKIIVSYQRHISAILRDFFFVKVVNSYLYDPFSDQTHKTIEILGTVENTTIAEYCYYFLENQLASLWSQNKGNFRGNLRTEKNSYYLGVIKGFYLKLQKNTEKQCAVNSNKGRHCRENSESLRSLMVAGDTKLNNYVKMKFPKLQKIASHGPKIYKNTYSTGVEAGQKLTFHKGVSKRDGYKANLLN